MTPGPDAAAGAVGSPEPPPPAPAGATREGAAPGPSSAASKIAPPPLMGRAPRPSAVRIRKPAVLGVAVAGAALLAGSLTWAFLIQPELRAQAMNRRVEAGRDDPEGSARPPGQITDQPRSYDQLPGDVLPPPRGGPEPGTEAVEPVAVHEGEPAPHLPRPVGPSLRAQAAQSDLFFAVAAPGGTAVPSAQPPFSQPSQAAAPGRPAGPDLGAMYSPHGLVAPASPYELKAGALVPAVLLTAIDTSRPGPVLAAVTRNVFDTVTGRHLLLPQGSRLIGRHEGDSAYGDRRAYLVWERVILPNGKSLLLADAPGVDGQGAVGVVGRADRRLLQLGLATLLSGAVTTLGEFARGGARDEDRGSFLGSAGDAASIEASRLGGRLLDRELQVRPAIRVRPGSAVRVLITRDLILEPYRP